MKRATKDPTAETVALSLAIAFAIIVVFVTLILTSACAVRITEENKQLIRDLCYEGAAKVCPDKAQVRRVENAMELAVGICNAALGRLDTCTTRLAETVEACDKPPPLPGLCEHELLGAEVRLCRLGDPEVTRKYPSWNCGRWARSCEAGWADGGDGDAGSGE